MARDWDFEFEGPRDRRASNPGGVSVTLRTDNRAFRKAGRFVSNDLPNLAVETAIATAQETLKIAREYPPLMPGNFPPPPYYERGFGIRGVKKDNPTSEQMNRRWEILKGERRGGTLAGSFDIAIRNVASYSMVVIGPWQTPLHASTGWEKVENIAIDVAATYMKKAEVLVYRYWNEDWGPDKMMGRDTDFDQDNFLFIDDGEGWY